MPGSLLYVSVLCLLSICSACYISNCPIGGKRSLTESPSRKCMACGPGDRGHCFGPSICCGAALGCYIGSPEAAVCVEENYLSSPCETGGRACGSEGGHCAAPGLCCDTDGCSTDLSCLPEEDTSESLGHLDGTGSGLGGGILKKLLYLAGQQPAAKIHQ